jgi:superfamily I DNA/RNA helicase
MARRQKERQIAPLNEEQLTAVLTTEGPVRVAACAGSGKTMMLVERCAFLIEEKKVDPDRVLLVTFSSDAKMEMERRLKKRLPDIDMSKSVRTAHSIGLQVYKAEHDASWNIDPTGKLYKAIIQHVLAEDGITVEGNAIAVKSWTAMIWDFAEVVKREVLGHHEIAEAFGAVDPRMDALGSPQVRAYYRKVEQLRKQGVTINGQFVLPVTYDDMLYDTAIAFRESSVRERWARRYDYVMQDECLVGDTPIMCRTGTRTIAEMVATQHVGPVLSWDPKRGPVWKRVTGWRRVPTGKRMVRVGIRRCLFRRDGSRLAVHTERIATHKQFVVCTEDHPVWTVNGWMAAGRLGVGDYVKAESHSPYTSSYANKYKISSRGCASLARHMSDKNASGVCGGHVPPPGNFPRHRRGGNGRGPSPTEASLLERLGTGWHWNYVVPTGRPSSNGPTHYKIDLAHPGRQFAVEVDGSSHYGPNRRAADRRKTAWLQRRGWAVIRLTNKEAAAITDDLLHQRLANSPVLAQVVSVDEWTSKDPFVYDLTVEDTHCYYADGVLVHNCQDESTVQRSVIESLASGSGNYCVVGDPAQALYNFRGGSAEGLLSFEERWPTAKTIKLVGNYRSGNEIIDVANQVLRQMPAQTVIDLQMICKRGTPSAVTGATYQNIGDEARAIAEDIFSIGKRSEEPDWREFAVLTRTNESLAALSEVFKQAELPHRVSGESFPKGARNTVTLCTIHAAKGRQWTNVYLAQAYDTNHDSTEERRVFYVAVTRARDRLTISYSHEGVRFDGQRPLKFLDEAGIDMYGNVV